MKQNRETIYRDYISLTSENVKFNQMQPHDQKCVIRYIIKQEQIQIWYNIMMELYNSTDIYKFIY